MADTNMIEKVKQMPLKNKMILASIVIMSIAGVILFFAWTQKADYQVLYSNLTEGDAGTIVQKLKELKIPYRLEAGSIQVPSDKVYDLRLQLASQGLPHGGGIGFELFDKTDFTTTDFVQKLNYKRALQGELARTITSLAEVEQSRVHLALPEKSLFMQEQNKPSASVLVKLKSGSMLSQSQVQGITHLVSSSVEGLQPRDITVIDSRGEMLTRHSDEIVGLSSSQLEYQKNYEKDIESRVLGILEPIVGKNKIRAKVSASIDFTKVEKREERFDPDGQVVRSEQKTIEKSNVGSGGGVPGVASNLPGKTGTAGPSSQSGSQKQNETINYEISKVTSHVISSTGDIKRLSVAVIVDGIYKEGKDSKEKKYEPRAEEDIRHYEDLVKKAVGFSEERGDEVRVLNMAFEPVAEEEFGETSAQYLPVIITVAKYAVPLVALLFFFLLVLKPLIKTLAPQPMVQRMPVSAARGADGQIEDGGRAKAIPDKTVQAEVIQWSKNNPEQAAKIIKGWLEER